MSFGRMFGVTEKQTPQTQNITNSTDINSENVDVIKLSNINKSFGNFKLFDNFNFTVPDFCGKGQFISILGASGCGKSVTLRMISGLEKPDSGTVEIYGKPLKPNESIPMVFQQYSAFPYKTVLQNIALPLELRGVDKSERTERAMEMIKLVGLEGKENQWASRACLSGGQLQRVSIARSLIAQEDKVMLLLDEPFSALDFIMREQMQQTLFNIYNNSKFDPSILLVTHQIDESILLSNRVYIMAANPGRIHSVIDIDLGENRDISIKTNPRYLEYVAYVENEMNIVNNMKIAS